MCKGMRYKIPIQDTRTQDNAVQMLPKTLLSLPSQAASWCPFPCPRRAPSPLFPLFTQVAMLTNAEALLLAPLSPSRLPT
jgi:hypothetical protein